jgi:hypothetical protein
VNKLGLRLSKSGVSSVSMNAHSLVTTGSLFGTVWGIVGPLVGVVIGAWLAHAWQHKYHPPETKKAEYRELRVEDWEKLRDVLIKMARRDLVMLNDSSRLVSGGHDQRPN